MSASISTPDLSPNWQSYLCKINSELASVFVDLEFRDSVLATGFPQLHWLWIKLRCPRPDGLSSDEEFQALSEIEGDVFANLDPHNIRYAGRVTTAGRREFYFYVTSGFNFEKILDELMARHGEYLFQLGNKFDPDWSHYFMTLYPGKNELEQINS